MFELFFATRHLAQELSKRLSNEAFTQLRLSQYTQWFEPFVVHWIALAKTNGCKWIQSSIDQDPFTPIHDSELYSNSVLDVFTALYEILDFWDKIQWPGRPSSSVKLLLMSHTDKEAAEEFLFDKLVDSVCTCVVYFTEQLLKIAQEFLSSASGEFRVSTAFCVLLNNLDHAGTRIAPF